MEERSQLVNVAYRLLGSLTEAEDAVQEAYARWFAMPAAQRAGIANPAAWLTRVAGRICLDVLGSARVRRERYVGSWLPEPLPLVGDDLAGRIAADETVTMAFLVVLDSLTPAERVAFVLHDVFGYPFAEVAATLGRTAAACRQLATSARQRLRKADLPSPAAREASLVRDFRLAWEAMDIDRLVGLLDPNVTVIADGGGAVSTVARPITGRAQVARYAVGLPLAGQVFEERPVNGRPGLVARRDGVIVSVLAFGVTGDRIRDIWVVRNPAKLHHFLSSAS
ncbi:RNA polymerase sigma factor SigJ [Actinoplanes sp. NPDC051411]|uniref:RNA polymerase sigma factor SigJ n=1 Tax=Actinoplanes sp. NPDC051411 TaxID=3155522 RepID=UPI003449C853